VPDDTQALTTAMAAGDAAAVAVFYRAQFDFMYAAARRATGRDESFCLDVVQDATLRIVRTVRPVATLPQLRAWVRLVVQTTAYDRLRADARRTRREAEVVVGHPAESTLADDRQTWLVRQLARLDAELVRLIDLRYDRNWTLARIAESLGLSIGTVDGRLRRAIQHLRDLASEQCDE
jgi:RNA polymerase sigma factor (sigma-70 family)